MAHAVERHVGQIMHPDESGERLGDFLGYQGQSAGPSENAPSPIGWQPLLHLVAQALAVSLNKPLEWAIGFFFGNPELALELRTVIAGIS